MTYVLHLTYLYILNNNNMCIYPTFSNTLSIIYFIFISLFLSHHKPITSIKTLYIMVFSLNVYTFHRVYTKQFSILNLADPHPIPSQ